MSVKDRLKAKRIVTPVDIGGDTFHVRGLTLGELDACEARAKEFPEGVERKVEFGKCLLAVGVCDETGQPVFADVADRDGMDEIATDVLRALVDKIADVNGYGAGEDESKS